MRPVLRLPGAAFLCATLAGCASVTSGLTQSVTVTPVCEGRIVKASCELSSEKGRWQLEAPGAVTVQKALGDLQVACGRGTARGTATFVSKANDNVYGNILVGGLVGLAIDSASGAGYKYPEELPVVLVPPCGADGGN